LYASLFRNRSLDSEQKKKDGDAFIRTEGSIFKGDAAFDSFMVGDFFVFGHTFLNTLNMQSMLDGVFMYPALLIAFKMGGGLEIGLGESFLS